MNKEIKKPLMANHNPTPLEALEKCEWSLGENGWLKYRRKDISIIKTALSKAKKQEKELNELEDFARIVLNKGIDAPLIKEYSNITYVDYNMKSRFELGTYTKTEFDLVKKVVEKYGKKN